MVAAEEKHAMELRKMLGSRHDTAGLEMVE